MKKFFLLCVLLFVFMQTKAQMYIIYFDGEYNASTGLIDYNITTISPDGSTEVDYWQDVYIYAEQASFDSDVIGFYQKLQEHVNPLLEQGYHFINPFVSTLPETSLMNPYEYTFFLAAPWTTVGLTEFDSSELDLRISPNPAKEYINVEVDFKSQPSVLVLISEQGYIYFKKDISNVVSGQELTLDISNVPAGKYLVTVKNDQKYLTPKKIIIL